MAELKGLNRREMKFVAALRPLISRLNPVLGTKNDSPYKKWRAWVISRAVEYDLLNVLVGWSLYNAFNKASRLNIPDSSEFEEGDPKWHLAKAFEDAKKRGWYYTLADDIVSVLHSMEPFNELSQAEFWNICRLVTSIGVQRSSNLIESFERIGALVFDAVDNKWHLMFELWVSVRG